MEEMIDRKSLRFSAILLVTGVVLFILVTVLFHPGSAPDNDEAGTCRGYANQLIDPSSMQSNSQVM
jgi:hypothetical protein